MPELGNLLDPKVVAAMKAKATPTLEACSCEPHTGSFNNLPGSTLVVHSCGKPKARALAMYPAQYEAALASEPKVDAYKEADRKAKKAKPAKVKGNRPAPRPQDTLTVRKVGEPGPKHRGAPVKEEPPVAPMVGRHMVGAEEPEVIPELLALAKLVGAPTKADFVLVPSPEWEASLMTEINGVLVDMRSEGLFLTPCADCQEPIEVEIAPKGVDLDLLTSKPRVAVCTPCGKARLANEKGTVIHKKKESPVDLNNYSPAQLAQFVTVAQDRLRALAAEALPAKVAKAVADETKRVAADQEVKVEQREARKGWVLDGFTLHKVEVPVLDLSDVSNLDEVASATVRSPYNKALYRNGEATLKPEAATYKVLAEVHQRLATKGVLANLDGTEKSALKVVTGLDEAEIADLGGLPKAKKAKGKGRKKAKQVTAVLEADAPANAQVKALMKARPDLTQERAREIVASL